MEQLVKEISAHHHSHRQAAKLKHVNACLLPESQYKKSAGFETVELLNQSASELSLNDISLTTSFLGKNLKAPLMIAPMTGGIEFGGVLNRRFAKACEHFGLPFGVGSQRLALLDQTVRESFNVRAIAKNTMIFANMGAAQLLGDDGPTMAMRAVEMINADAMFIHLNPLQEAVQERGDVNFTGLLLGITRVVTRLQQEKIPVLVREVGFGFSQKAALALINTGIDGLDCAGAGGTSWTKVEALCATNEKYRRLGDLFGEWGIPTVESIRNVRAVDQHIPLIATGGLRSGLDVAKALAMGADLSSMAQPMLKAAIMGEEQLHAFIDQILAELRIALFAAGFATVEQLKAHSLTR